MQLVNAGAWSRQRIHADEEVCIETSVSGGGEEPRVALYERLATAGPSERAALAQAIEMALRPGATASSAGG